MLSLIKSSKRLGSVTLVTLAGTLLLLTGCGGGGSEGAPFNPSPTQPPVVVPPLVINPNAITVYANTPGTLTIAGGVPPYTAFSADQTVLPVTQNLTGAFINLIPSNVLDNTTVVITVRDSAGTQSSATATVKPNVMSTEIKITADISQSALECKGTVICSGQFGLAEVRLKNSMGQVLPNRQVRFDAVQGQYNFTLNDAGTSLAKTITVLTDVNGYAQVRIKADVNAITAVALIRATDVTTANRVDGNFGIAQFTSGSNTMTVTPSSIAWSAFYNTECVSTLPTTFYVYGGTAPYSIKSTDKNVVSINTPKGSDTGIVSTNGGYFLGYAVGDVCTDEKGTAILITDATGRNITATFINKIGTNAVPAAPVIIPSISLSNTSNTQLQCGQSATIIAAGGGDSPSLSVAINDPAHFIYDVSGRFITVTRRSFDVIDSPASSVAVYVTDGKTYATTSLSGVARCTGTSVSVLPVSDTPISVRSDAVRGAATPFGITGGTALPYAVTRLNGGTCAGTVSGTITGSTLSVFSTSATPAACVERFYISDSSVPISKGVYLTVSFP